MKKIISVLLLVAICACMFSLAGCGKSEPAVTEIGMWDIAEIQMWGPVTPCCHYEAIVLHSDNTFTLITDLLCYYSADNGETYNPTFDFYASAHGKYETVSEDKELGERTIKITEITDIIHRDTDSTQDSTLAEMVKNNAAVGTEVVLGMDHKMSARIGLGNFFDLPEN